MDDLTIRRHNGLGIASFILSLAVFFVLFIGMGAGMIVQASGRATQPVFVMVGLFIVLAGLLAVIGIGLGIAGLLDPESKKAFPALGVILSGGLVLLTTTLIILG